MNKKNGYIIIIVCIILSSLGTIINFIESNPKRKVFIEQMPKYAEEVNKNLPRILDHEIRCDFTSVPE